MTDWHVAQKPATAAGTPGYCAIVSHFPNAPLMTYTRNKTGKASLMLDFENAELEKDRKYGVTFTVDGEAENFAARALSKTKLVFQTDNDRIYDSFVQGNPVTVALDGTAGVYTLSGTKQAFAEFN
ncbi:MAG: hypothetical protein JWM96_1118, partial [Alphaproteobacteria bacterium]|nr:hypothetical protein [Alphaproteobacteria bacterium]